MVRPHRSHNEVASLLCDRRRTPRCSAGTRPYSCESILNEHQQRVGAMDGSSDAPPATQDEGKVARGGMRRLLVTVCGLQTTGA